jgi:adenine/guanine phosphoribosyltransferase-like PRPP-binding protein
MNMKLLNKAIKLSNNRHQSAIKLNWSHIEKAIIMWSAVLSNKKFDSLLVMVRGGMVPAVMLSHRMSCRKLRFFQGMRTATNKPRDYCDLTLINLPEIKNNERIVIIEDIVYKGDTTHAAINYIKEKGAKVVCVCTLVVDEDYNKLAHPETPRLPLYTGYICPSEAWVRFPWEQPIKGEIKANEQ